MDRKILTPEGLNKLQTELDYLKNTKRKEVSERIKTAKEFGDLSENAEYQEAKDEQAFVEGQILELESIVKTAVMADKQDNGVAQVGSHIKVEKDGQTSEFTIVGSTEADPIHGKISVESPLGEALLNRKIDEEFEIELPVGLVKYKIIEID